METTPAGNLQQAVPFFNVMDIQRSVRYYVEGLGFTRNLEWVKDGVLRWCNLQRDGVNLMLQEFWKGGEGHPPNVPDDKLGVGVSICIFCRDALALYQEFTGKGITVAEPFVGNNQWVVSLTDPDGYKIEFESATDVPEETTYSEWLELTTKK